MICGIVSGFLGNTLFTVVVVGLLFSLYRFSGRAGLFKFFGVGDSRQLSIYVSHLLIPLDTAIGADGMAHSFTGSVGTLLEALNAASIERLFKLPFPLSGVQPSWLAFVLLADVKTQVSAAPMPCPSSPFKESMVVIGSPFYNSLANAV